MSKNIQNYFTTGELSQLCKIPRKTLLYYDKLGLITPELVDETLESIMETEWEWYDFLC